MRWLINPIRSLFANMNGSILQGVTNYSDWTPRDMPMGYTEIYRYKKCGYVQKIHY